MRLAILLAVACVGGVATGCVKASPAIDAGDPGFPFGPSSVGVRILSYTQDIKPVLDSDCLACHSDANAQGGYSVSTYSSTVARQRIGDASSSLVVDSSPGGSMYRYFTGDAVTKATEIFRWLVYYNAVENP